MHSIKHAHHYLMCQQFIKKQNKKQLIPSLSVQSIRLYHDQVKLNLCENSCFLDF